jgi:hypothetical protein
MKILHDFRGLAIRLTDERREHILEHPEMMEMEPAIEETLRDPERVVLSLSDPEVHLYFASIFELLLAESSSAW